MREMRNDQVVNGCIERIIAVPIVHFGCRLLSIFSNLAESMFSEIEMVSISNRKTVFLGRLKSPFPPGDFPAL